MPLLDDQDVTTRAIQRAEFRVKVVATKLNRRELDAFKNLAKQRGQKSSDCLRGLILAELAKDTAEAIVSTELTEIIGLRLMLTNLLKPIATGQKLTPELFEAVMTEVRKSKVLVASELMQQNGGF